MTSIYDASREYRTRDGCGKLVHWIEGGNSANRTYPHLAVLECAGGNRHAAYADNLSFYSTEHPSDLLPVEPVVSEWVNLYRPDGSSTHFVFTFNCGEDAMDLLANDDKAVACIRIDRQGGKIIKRELIEVPDAK